MKSAKGPKGAAIWEFDLCICSVGEDGDTAKELQKRIAAYRLPKNVTPPEHPLGYKSVALDINARPLDVETRSVLDRSHYLLVICSPGAKDSEAVRERLLYFEGLRGRQNIIALIIEGEPADAFPPFFIEQKKVSHLLPDGTIEERIETVEPVASDLRGATKSEVARLYRYETVRIIASVLELPPDALEQRHNRRARRRLTAIVSVVSAVLLTVGGVFGYFGAVAAHEGNIAARQLKESGAVIQRLLAGLPESFADNPLALNYVEDALYDAVDSLQHAGSTQLPQLSASGVFVPAEGDSAETLLRKAAALRLLGSAAAIDAYSLAAYALEMREHERELFIHSMNMLAAESYGRGLYIPAAVSAAPEFFPGDILLTLEGVPVGAARDFTSNLHESFEETVTVGLLRSVDGAGYVLVEQAAGREGLMSLTLLEV